MNGIPPNGIKHDINSNWQWFGHRLTGEIYGTRHLAKLLERDCSSIGKLGHVAIGVVECIPLIGSVMAAVEGRFAGISFWETFIHSNRNRSRSDSFEDSDSLCSVNANTTPGSFSYSGYDYSLAEWPENNSDAKCWGITMNKALNKFKPFVLTSFEEIDLESDQNIKDICIMKVSGGDLSEDNLTYYIFQIKERVSCSSNLIPFSFSNKEYDLVKLFEIVVLPHLGKTCFSATDEGQNLYYER